MEDIKILYNRKIVFCIIGVIIASFISLGIILTTLLLIGVAAYYYHYSPLGFDWIKKPLAVLTLQKDGLKIYGQYKPIPWEDIDTFYIKFNYYGYTLCLDIKEELRITSSNKLLYDSLRDAGYLNETNEGRLVVKYPYDLLACSKKQLYKNIDNFLKAHSDDYLVRMKGRQEFYKGIEHIGAAVVIVLLLLNLVVSNGYFFLISCTLTSIGVFITHLSYSSTPYLIFTKEGFQLPTAKLELDWHLLKLVETQSPTRDTQGALIIWFNDIKSYMDSKQNLPFDSYYMIGYDENKLYNTGRLVVKCARTTVGEDALRDEFQKYIAMYGSQASKTMSKRPLDSISDPVISLEKDRAEVADLAGNIEENKVDHHDIEIKGNVEIEDSNAIGVIAYREDEKVIREVEDRPDQKIINEIELNKLVDIRFKRETGEQQVFVLKQDEDYCMAVRVVGLSLDGYCIFRKSGIAELSYCHNYYNELLNKEYYFKLNSGYHSELKGWQSIINNYHMGGHFVEVRTPTGIHKGLLSDILEDKVVVRTVNLDKGYSLDSIDIDLESIISAVYETSELRLLEKYNS